MKKIMLINVVVILLLVTIIVAFSIIMEQQKEVRVFNVQIDIRSVLNYIYPIFVVITVSNSIFILVITQRKKNN